MNRIQLEKKALNGLLFTTLMRLQHKMPVDFDKEIKEQSRRAKELAVKAYAIPFYKERFDKAGVKPEDIQTADDFVKLPVLTKNELREWMNSLVDNPAYRDYFKDTTSGSTGQPLTILYSPREKACNMANWIRVLMLSGYNPFTGKTMNRMDVHGATGGRKSAIQKLGILRRELITKRYVPDMEIIDQINAYQPDLLYLGKSELMRLCLYCKNNNVSLHQPKYYAPIGEKIDDNARTLFKEMLGDGIIDAYGTSETGSILLRLFDDDKYMIHHDLFAVNVVDNDGNPADEGRILVTPLYKTDLPLINYEVGDSVTLMDVNGVKYVKSINGRMNDFIKYRNGEITSFSDFNPIITHCSDIYQIKIIQKSYDKIHIQCVQNKEESQLSYPELEEKLNREFAKVFKAPFEVTYEWLDTIPEDANGKIRVLVCEVKD